tara:strand:- start:2182 stop:3045 length:864 start_codon:yes stop_codon:yes gene_type:complete
MKKLDTLVEDIYDKLSVLGDGESLDVSEEVLDEFGNSMKEALRHWANPTPRDTETLRMSNIGKPLRQLWYDLKSEGEETQPLEPHLFIRFLYGHILEEVMLFLVKLAGHKVTDEQKEVKVSGVHGHMDCKIDGEVIDIKTASSFAFRKFKNGTLAEDDPFGYLAQLSAYETAEKTKAGGFLVLNKESGEITLHRPSFIDKPHARNKIREVKKAIKLDNPPELCYNPVPEGKAGNMKLPRGCTYCRHKNECHKDANDGKGLRVFKYSKGLMYLTKVEKEPNVLEITRQ